ncbi:MAG: ABC transporter substrate-binding protein [Bacteroidales bacterium]|nr:ABC transporter substrate-binding protein [Bacteroidales bacterium]
MAFSCNGGKRSEAAVVSVASLRGPSSVAMIRLIDSLSREEAPSFRVEVFTEPLQVRKLMLTDSVDIAVLPTTMAALLYNKGVDYRMAAVPLWGTLYLCGTDTSIRTVEDLKGKKVFLMAKGMTPDVMFRHLLWRNGLEPYADVALDYRFPTHTDLANAAMAGRAPMCVLTEPYLSQALNANPALHVLLDLNEEWARVESAPVAETALVVRSAFAEASPEAVSAFVEAYRASVEWVNANPDSAAALAVQYGINPDSAAVAGSVPRCNMRVEAASEVRKAIIDYLRVFYDMEPETIGGKMPDEEFIVK